MKTRSEERKHYEKWLLLIKQVDVNKQYIALKARLDNWVRHTTTKTSGA